MVFFFKRSRAANSAVSGRIVLNFELIRDNIVALLTYKLKMKEQECSQQYTLIFRRPRAAYSLICGGISPKFKLIQAFMHVLVTCKNEEDPVKNEGARVFTRVLPV